MPKTPSTPTATAIARRLRQNGEDSTFDRDAEDIARIVTKHWGDFAKIVLRKALDIVEPPTPTTDEGP